MHLDIYHNKLNTVESNYRDGPAGHNKVQSNFSAQSETNGEK